jgi:hypothetical protein
MISLCSQVGGEDWAWELEALEVEAAVWGILSLVQDFYQTGGVQLAIQVVNNNLKKMSNPLQKRNTPTQ